MTDTTAEIRDVLPGEPIPYMVEAGAGRRYIGKSGISRVMASGRETGGEVSVTSLMFAPGGEIPPHYHEPRSHPEDFRPEATVSTQHDLMFCLYGRMQFWANDECRILGPGDVLSIPPGTVHAARALSLPTMMLAPVVPPGWIRFFDLLSRPLTDDGPQLPTGSEPPSGEITRSAAAHPQFEKAVEEKLLKPVPYDFPEPRFDAADDRLPDGVEPYYLRAGRGPRYALFDQLCFQLMTGAQSDGRIAMTVTEGAAGDPVPAHLHERTYEGIFCLDGEMRVVADGVEHRLRDGDFLSIPQGVEHSYGLDSHFTRFVTMSAPAGTELLYEIVGERTEQSRFGPTPPPDPGKLTEAESQIDIRFT